MDDLIENLGEPASTRPSKDEIYSILRRRICLLSYAPGARLNERDLAQEFGVSRTPLRSALQRLENDRLIASHHGQGTTVTPIDLSKMQDIYQIRMNLMDALAESTPLTVDETVIRKFEAAQARCLELTTSQSKHEFAEVTIELNSIVHGLTSNEILREFNEVLFYQSIRFWFLLLDKLDFTEHAKELAHEMAMLHRSLTMGDVAMTAMIHKTHLGLVLAHLKKSI